MRLRTFLLFATATVAAPSPLFAQISQRQSDPLPIGSESIGAEPNADVVAKDGEGAALPRGREISLVNLTGASDAEVRAIIDQLNKVARAAPPAYSATLPSEGSRLSSKLIVEITGGASQAEIVKSLLEKGFEVESNQGESVVRVAAYVPSTPSKNADLASLLAGRKSSTINTAEFSMSEFERRRRMYQQVVGPQVGGALNNPKIPRPNDALNLGPGSLSGPLGGSQECQDAAQDLALLPDFSSIAFDELKLRRQSSAVSFVTSCLAPIIPTEGSPLPRLPDFVENSGALGVMGVLELAYGTGVSSVFCSGFLVDARRVVTARHCFFDDDQAGEMRPEIVAAMHYGNIGFRRLVPSFQLLPIAGVAKTRSDFDGLRGGNRDQPIRASADVLVLDLGAEAENVAPVEFTTAVNWRHEAWIAGPVESIVAPASTDNVPTAVRSIRWSSGTECAVYPKEESCLLHVCQAVGDFSGAALFVRDAQSGRAKIAGMHLGPYSKLSPVCKSLDGYALVNGSYTVERGANGGVGVRYVLEYLDALIYDDKK
jgi:hypothetical protein